MEMQIKAKAVVSRYKDGQYGASIIAEKTATTDELKEYREAARYGNGKKVAISVYESNEMVIEGKSYE